MLSVTFLNNREKITKKSNSMLSRFYEPWQIIGASVYKLRTDEICRLKFHLRL